MTLSHSVNGVLDAYGDIANLYRVKNDWKNCKYYCLKYLEFCKAHNPNRYEYDGYLGMLVYACQNDDDYETGKKYWYQLKDYLGKKYGRNLINFSITDEINERIALIDLNDYCK